VIAAGLAGLLLATSPAPAPAPVPAEAAERPLLDAFKAACGRTGDDLEAMKADALSSGWAAMPEQEESRIARLLKIGREATEADGTSVDAAFRRTLDGRELFLIVSRYQDKSGFWGAGCRVYDFAATAPLPGPALEAWMGKPPTGVLVPDAGLSRRLWEPGWRDGIMLDISHVPQGHPAGEPYGLSGNILIAEAIGGF
jgi:hypothetical protein